MPFANGVFTRLFNGTNNWMGDATAGIKILAAKHDQHDKDIGDALSQTICRDGQSTIIGDIPFNGKRITDLGMAAVPGQKDAVNVNYVQTLSGWSTSKNISGADLDGRLNFTAATGVNGITWTYADVSWVARHSEASKTSNRLVMNNTVAPNTTGDAVGDVFVIDDSGHINNDGTVTSNLSWDGAAWRTIDPGRGTKATYANSKFTVSSNDVATITNKYALAPQREFFRVSGGAGASTSLVIDSTGNPTSNVITGSKDTNSRWMMELGNGIAETATERVGSNFTLCSFNNNGSGLVVELGIDRVTHKATFAGEVAAPSMSLSGELTMTGDTMTVGPSTASSGFTMQRPIATGSLSVYGGVGTGSYLQLFGPSNAANGNDIILGVSGAYRYMYDYSVGIHYWRNNVPTINMTLNNAGDLSILGQLNVDSIITSTDTSMIIAPTAGGTIYFRPQGAGTGTSQVHISAAGDIVLQSAIPAATGGIQAGRGIRCKAGDNGAYGANWCNFNWTGSFLNAYVGAAPGGLLGAVAFQPCDYRIKKDIAPIGSTWDKVKKLNPISYSQRAWEVWIDDDAPRWGFLAHELQEQLFEGAASGKKDGDEIQTPNMMAIIAALTKALQEAMARIEVLEAVA